MDDHLDDRIDARLRAELRADLGPVDDANEVLESLTPAFARATRVHRARLVLASASMLAVLAGGIALLGSLASDGPQQLTVAEGPDGLVEPPVDDPSTADGVARPTTTIEVDVGTGLTDGDGSPSTVPASDGSATTAEPAGSATAPTPASSTLRPPSTAAPSIISTPSTSPSPSTTLGPGETAIETDCGTVIVLVEGSAVSVVDVEPKRGYRVDIKSDGPQEIEVGFEGGPDQCEVHGRMEGGRLVTTEEDDD